MFSWFKKKDSTPVNKLTTDIHSHLLPGLDDGVKSLEEAEEIILQFQQLGYKKIVTTPHVIQDQFRNTTENILEKLSVLKTHLILRNIPVTVEAAAEYYLDENLVHMIQHNQPLLTFGNNYLLFETNFLSEPFILKEFIFLASTKGYKLVLAHPERYIYLQNNILKLEDLLSRGVLFQVNLNSIIGYYSKPAQVTAQKLIDNGWVHFLGSDCHHLQHVNLINEIQHAKYFRKALSLPLLNNSL